MQKVSAASALPCFCACLGDNSHLPGLARLFGMDGFLAGMQPALLLLYACTYVVNSAGRCLRTCGSEHSSSFGQRQLSHPIVLHCPLWLHCVAVTATQRNVTIWKLACESSVGKSVGRPYCASTQQHSSPPAAAAAATGCYPCAMQDCERLWLLWRYADSQPIAYC